MGEVLKTASWQGKRQTPLLNRIDIGVVPKKGADSLHKTDNTYFLNEIEMICTTWLDRYSPISVPDVVAQAAVKHSLELLVGLLKSKRRVPDEKNVKKVVDIMQKRLGLKLRHTQTSLGRISNHSLGEHLQTDTSNLRILSRGV